MALSHGGATDREGTTRPQPAVAPPLAQPRISAHQAVALSRPAGLDRCRTSACALCPTAKSAAQAGDGGVVDHAVDAVRAEHEPLCGQKVARPEDVDLDLPLRADTADQDVSVGSREEPRRP